MAGLLPLRHPRSVKAVGPDFWRWPTARVPPAEAADRKLAFLGQYEHTLDAKNRLTIPSRFRAALSDGVILARSLDPCVSIYTPEGWERFTSDWLRTRDPFDPE